MKKTNLLLAALSVSPTAQTAIDISHLPVSGISGVAPNVTFSFDDSKSMTEIYLPDSIRHIHNKKRFKSSDFNLIYYNPEITYLIPPKTALKTSFNSALEDGYNKHSPKVDLATEYTFKTDHCAKEMKECNKSGHAYYYQHNGSIHKNNDNNYTKVLINEAQKQNFANWFSYYRTRLNLAKSASALTFDKLANTFRLNYQTINNSGKGLNDLKAFDNNRKKELFKWLYSLKAKIETPLISSLVRVGESYKQDAPYRDDPADKKSPMRECRGNYHVTMTDGAWNEGNTKPDLGGNLDGSTDASYPIGDNDLGLSGTYSHHDDTSTIYRDNNKNYLSDAAFNYWITDLNPRLGNHVHPSYDDMTTDIDGDGETNNRDIFWNPRNNPAKWQHLVNLNIILGENGTLTPHDDFQDLLSGKTQWGNGKADDFWHSAINSRGKYFAAHNTQALSDALESALNRIFDPNGSGTAVAVNSSRLNVGSLAYQASFNLEARSGGLKAFKFSDGTGAGSQCNNLAMGVICDRPEWSAAEALSRQGWDFQRSILTFDTEKKKGIPFRWSALPQDQKNTLHNKDVLEYIRGNTALEGKKQNDFRERQALGNSKNILGDIINNGPLYVGRPMQRFSDPAHSDPITGFKASHKNRKNIVYVGANDGMLHAFDGDNGEELLAYVPRGVFNNLAKFPKKGSQHQAFLDGSLVSSDIVINGQWQTALVGTLGLGGNSVFALNITDPITFSEHNASHLVLWEFTDADMGIIRNKPIITRLNNGEWVALFNNGYNSPGGNAYLYVVSMKDGTLIRKIPTTQKLAENGLSAIVDVDLGEDADSDLVYAGDVHGNLWQFDISDNNPNAWRSSIKFKSIDNDGNVQPITAAPAVRKHPTGNGQIVYVGTGQYLGISDIINKKTQTLYGVWVKSGTQIPQRRHLLEQTFETGIKQGQFPGVNTRVITNKAINWHDAAGLPSSSTTQLGWYIDFVIEEGERISSAPFLRSGKLIFLSVTPSSNPCDNSGSSYLYEINSTTGGRLSKSPFDYNFDGNFDGRDNIKMNTGDQVSGSAIQLEGTGVYHLTGKSIITLPNGHEVKNVSSSTGRILSIGERSDAVNRRSWREVR